MISLVLGVFMLFQAPQDTIVVELPDLPRVMLEANVRERLLDGYRHWRSTAEPAGVCLYGDVVSTPVYTPGRKHGTVLHATNILEVNEPNCPHSINYNVELIGFLQFINRISMQVTKQDLMKAACSQLDRVNAYYRVTGYMIGIKFFPTTTGMYPYEETVGCVRTRLQE